MKSNVNWSGKKTLGLLSMLLVTSYSVAQVSVGGNVTDQNQSLAGVTIALLTLDSVMISGAVSDSLGAFIFKGVTPGTYQISATMVGYITLFSNKIYVSKDHILLPPIKLDESPVALKEITIEAGKLHLDQQLDRLVINTQNSITSSGTTVLEILAKSPGIIVNKQTNSISMNGKSGVKIMINGKIMPAQDAVVQMLDGMSASNVESIELIAAPSSKLDADGNGGVIHIITKRNEELGTQRSVGLTIGARWAENIGGNFAVNHRRKKTAYFFDYAINSNHNRHTLEIARQLPAGEFRHPVTVYGDRKNVTIQQNLNVGLEWKLTANTTLSLSAMCYSRDWRLNALNTDRNQVATDSLIMTKMKVGQSNVWQSATSSVSLQSKMSQGHEITFGVDYLYYHNDNPSNYNLVASFDDVIKNEISTVDLKKETPVRFFVGKLDYQYAPFPSLTFETGIKAVTSALYNHVIVNRQIDEVWMIDSAFTSHSTLTENILAGYISTQWRPKNNKWNLQAGIRYEYTHAVVSERSRELENLNRKYGYLFPSLLVTRHVTEEKKFQFSYTRRITRPTYNDIAAYAAFWSPNTFTAANAALWPAVSDAIAIGYHHGPGSLTLQFSNVTNEISALQPDVDEFSNALIYRSQNIRYVNTIALSNFYSYRPASWWEIQTYVTFQYQRGRSAHLEHNITFGLYGVNMNVINVMKLPKNFSLELSGVYQSRYRAGITEFLSVGSLNIGIQKNFGRKGIVRLAVDDLLYTNNWRNKTFSPENNLDIQFNYDWHNQFVRLSYSLSLGNNKLKAVKAKTSSDEERKRVGN